MKTAGLKLLGFGQLRLLHPIVLDASSSVRFSEFKALRQLLHAVPAVWRQTVGAFSDRPKTSMFAPTPTEETMFNSTMAFLGRFSLPQWASFQEYPPASPNERCWRRTLRTADAVNPKSIATTRGE
jgi:hypothetical protein